MKRAATRGLGVTAALLLAACHPAASDPGTSPDEEHQLNAAAAQLDTANTTEPQP